MLAPGLGRGLLSKPCLDAPRRSGGVAAHLVSGAVFILLVGDGEFCVLLQKEFTSAWLFRPWASPTAAFQHRSRLLPNRVPDRELGAAYRAYGQRAFTCILNFSFRKCPILAPGSRISARKPPRLHKEEISSTVLPPTKTAPVIQGYLRGAPAST